MSRRWNRTATLRVVMSVLFAVCSVQVMWWVVEEATFVTRVREEVLDLHRSHANAATALATEGVTAERIEAMFPSIVVTESGVYQIAPAVEAELAEMLRSRINRYAWEGGFFLLVLIIGLGVIGSAVRQEARARKQEQDFLAVVSHELKTPLASMRLSAETIALRDPPQKRRQQLITRILGDADRLESMVVNVLDVARLEHHGFSMQRQEIPLRPAVDAALSKVHTAATAANVNIDVELAERLMVSADPEAVRTVVENLVGNAIKATTAARDAGDGTDGDTERRVKLTAVAEGNWAVLTVRDAGIGFEAADSKRIFEKFYRASSGSGPVRGSGLGLYLVRRLAEKGGGKALATSPGRGHGATFEVRWPLAAGEGAR